MCKATCNKHSPAQPCWEHNNSEGSYTYDTTSSNNNDDNDNNTLRSRMIALVSDILRSAGGCQEQEQQIEQSLRLLSDVCCPQHPSSGGVEPNNSNMLLLALQEAGATHALLHVLQTHSQQPRLVSAALGCLLNATCFYELLLLGDGLMETIVAAMNECSNDVHVQVLGCACLGNILEGSRRMGRQPRDVDPRSALSVLVQASQGFPRHAHLHWSAVRFLALLSDQEEYRVYLQQPSLLVILEHAKCIFGGGDGDSDSVVVCNTLSVILDRLVEGR